MTSDSNNNGRAYEYVCLLTLQQEISKIRSVKIIENSSLAAAKHAWDAINIELQGMLRTSAQTAVAVLFNLERRILEDDNDTIELLIQKDEEGENGDVRDILIIRRNIHWEIGLSMKHNHFAVKHSRLSSSLDFGEKWFGQKCSDEYWAEVTPIFDYLKQEKAKGATWNELPNKIQDVYEPLLIAFMNEIKRSYLLDVNMPKKMVEYLLGKYDFYKVVSEDGKRATMVQAINLHNTLGQPDKANNGPFQKVPVTNLPNRLISISIKPNSNNTVELYLDEGWQFSFRIHNAATQVEPSLKFDIQLIGMPTTVMTIEQKWN